MGSAMSNPESAITATGGAPPGFHRLKPFQSVRKSFVSGFFFALVWTVVTGFFVYAHFNETNPENQSSFFVILILVVINTLVLIWPAKSFLRLVMTGQTTVDVSSEIALPGEKLEVIVSQPGKFIIDKCTVDFVCEERARFNQGTDTIT